MTDATNRKLDVKDNEFGDIARDDPLYELSQIIGFSRPAEPEQPRQGQDDNVDLEQELLRELDNFPVPGRSSAEVSDYQDYSEPEPVEPIAAPEQSYSSDPLDFDSEFERDFGGVFKVPEPARPEPVAPEPVVDAVDMEEPDPMEAELFQPEFESGPAPQPVFAEVPRFEPEPEPAPQPASDSLEDELLDLLGSIGEKAKAPWTAEPAPVEQIVVDEPVAVEQPDFDAYVSDVDVEEAQPEAVAEPPSTAPRPLWFDEPEPVEQPVADARVETVDEQAAEIEPAVELEPDEDSALLDAFESELSEGLSISLDEMSQEEAHAQEDLSSDFSIEDELDLDRTYETAAAADEDEAIGEIESAANEIASAARPSMPPVLDTADLSGGDMEAMHPLDLPQQAEETVRSEPNDIERELDAALTGYDQYEDQPTTRLGAAAAMPAANYDLDAIENDLARDMDYVAHDLEARSAEEDDFEGFEDEFDEPVIAPQPVERPRSGRGMMIAAIVGGVAILGAFGAFALMGSDVGDDGGPVLVKADSDPVKIVPEDPGGRQVPNQDRAVYGEVDGNGETAPTQDTLVSTSEEPIDLNGGSASLPSGITETAKVEDRLMPEAVSSDGMSAAGDDGQALLPPRRVRTVIVKPDGSFVPTPTATATAQPEPAPQTAEAAVTQPEATRPAATDTQVSATQGAQQDDAEALQQMASVSEPETTAAPEPAQTASRNIPTPAVIPERPTNQPVQVASQPAPAPAPAIQTQPAVPGGYMVQISSQPSAALAQQSATDLSRRFGNLLGGRAISIQQAEIEGRGTFHRVRVAASGRDDAVALCESLKRAGGSCFVTR